MSADTLPAGSAFAVNEVSAGSPGIRTPRESTQYWDPKAEKLRTICRIMARQGVRDWLARQ
jgi:hypothetical protein